MFDVSGKRAIITGGAQGFGRELARRLLQKGCRVCVTDLDETKGLEAKEELKKQFGLDDDSIHFIKFDVTDKDGWNLMWDEAERVLNGKIDILANNAGINPGFGWEMCLKVMSVGATRGVFTAVERMSTKKGGNGGRIVNTASVAGIMNIPMGSELTNAGYSVAKQGLVALTRYFSYLEEDSYKTEGIKCYALAPYLADTNLVRSHLEKMVNEGRPVTRGQTEIRTIDDYHKTGMTRALTVEEVGDAFMISFKQDKNGAVFAVMPDTPLIEHPMEQNGVMLTVIATAKLFGSLLGVEVFTPRHFYVIMAIALYVLCATVNFLFRTFIF